MLLLPALSLVALASASVVPTLHWDKRAETNTNNTADCTNCTNTGNSVDPLPVFATDPVVEIKNGSYAGLSIPPIAASATASGFGTNHAVEAFLGIPYARQPGPLAPELRFARPRPLNESWNDVRPAKRYSEHCYGVGTDNDYLPPYVTYKLGESCLTLNVVRPAHTSEPLPVFVWIHGGGFGYGGSGDVRYNGSFIVDRSITLDTPVMFVSLNYRTNLLGFPAGQQAHDAGIENLGLYDQRLALHWIQENIAAFNGDPTKVTVVGESAGGASVFHLLTAYDGRQDHLFRAVIAESGYYSTTPPTRNTTESRTQLWTSLVDYANCTSADNTLSCLRNLPLEVIKLFSEANEANMGLFNPVVDGDMVTQDMQSAFLQQKIVPSVSAIFNANLDEGISFGVRNVNTTQQVIRALNASQELPDGVLDSSAARRQLELEYPDDEDIYPPFQAGAGLLATSAGLMDRRSCALFGDLQFIGPKRQAATLMARTSTSGPVYVSRFDQLPYKAKIDGGAQHFTEVAYVFRNPLDSQNALGPRDVDARLADVLSSYWISFVATGDPNTAQMGGCLGEPNDGAPYWPAYHPADGGGSSIAWVNNRLGAKTRIIPDTYRRTGIELLMSLRAGSLRSSLHSEL